MRISIPGRSVLRRGLDRPSGITLIELLVAFAIVGVLFVVGVTALRGALDVDLKSSSRELASLIRYLRTKAVTENKYLRLVLDLENSRYWVEASENPYVISPGEEVSASSSKGEGFQKLEERLARQRSLPSGVFFKDVVVSYSKEKQEKGEAFLYFFPDGFATRSMINLRDEEDKDHYSLEVFPLSGRVVVTGEYREMEEG